jgi:NAD(P)-dependent dehydrogenase (short-subunit alcohol dehydrogenase family)
VILTPIVEIDARAGDETAHLAGKEAIAIRADVTDPDSLQSAIRATVDKFGRLDVLHNNAGGSVINMSSNVALMGSPVAIATPRQRAGSRRSPVRSLSLMHRKEFASMRLRRRRR